MAKTLNEMIVAYGVAKSAFRVARLQKMNQDIAIWASMYADAVEDLRALGFEFSEDLEVIRFLGNAARRDYEQEQEVENAAS